MTLWSEFTPSQKNSVVDAIKTECELASGVTFTGQLASSFNSLVHGAIRKYDNAGVRCIWSPKEIPGIVNAGRPYLPDIVGLLRNFEGNFLPKYGRRSESESTNKSGTEQVSLAAISGTLDEKITVEAPDIRAATIGTSSASDVDAAEKMRFDSETEKSLYLLFCKWVRRASVDEDF